MTKKASKSVLPFAGAVGDGYDMVRKIWGVSGLPPLPSPATMTQFAHSLPQALPSMIAPTLDVNELEKRIADLRAVEQWLNLNVSMLRTAIQSLEVQRNTIATLRSFSGAMMPAAMRPVQSVAQSAAVPAGVPVGAPAAATPAATEPARGVTRARKKTVAAPSGVSMPLNPITWWNTLHEQFAKVAAAATEDAGTAKGKARTAKRATRSTTRRKGTGG